MVGWCRIGWRKALNKGGKIRCRHCYQTKWTSSFLNCVQWILKKRLKRGEGRKWNEEFGALTFLHLDCFCNSRPIVAFCGWCVHMYFVAQKHNLKEKLCCLITSDFCLYRVICQNKSILWTFKSDMRAVRHFKCVWVKQTRVWNQQPDTFGEMRASLFGSVVASSNKLNMTSFCSKGVQEQE